MFSQAGLFDFSGGVAGDGIEENSAGSLVARQFFAEGEKLVFSHFLPGFQLDNRRRDFTQAPVGQADDCHVLNLGV